jgi:hypothetical protein
MGLPLPAVGTHWKGTWFVNVAATLAEGWSETFHLRSANYAAAKADMIELWEARRPTLCDDCRLVYSYVSDEGLKGDSLLVPIPGDEHDGTYGGTDTTTLPPWNVVLCRLESGPLYRSLRPLRGIPSDVQLNLPVALAATYHTALVSFLDVMKTKCFNHIKQKPGDPDATGNYRVIVDAFVERISERRSGRPFGLLRGRSRQRVGF